WEPWHVMGPFRLVSNAALSESFRSQPDLYTVTEGSGYEDRRVLLRRQARTPPARPPVTEPPAWRSLLDACTRDPHRIRAGGPGSGGGGLALVFGREQGRRDEGFAATAAAALGFPRSSGPRRPGRCRHLVRPSLLRGEHDLSRCRAAAVADRGGVRLPG